MQQPSTVGQLRASSYASIPVKEEIRRNVLRMLQRGETLFPGIVGYERTVIPEVVNAILSRHDFILLGLRGQAKTRIVRGLARLLDPLVPTLTGSPLHDDPFAPVSAHGRRLVAEGGDDTPITWVTPEERFREKLATPDVTIADLIGDVDPIKAANEGLTLDDEEVIQFGLVPRAHRGIFAINELPDLAPRIQVGLLNIMEEKDVQIRGFPVRLPVDVLMVFTANPEDYTNRGSIITPLKDRIDSQIQTHYPTDLQEAMGITEQEAWSDREAPIAVPEFVRRIVDEVVLLARRSEFVDQNSGVSARAAITAYENLLSNVERRTVLAPGSRRQARVCDLMAMVPALTGKIELAYEGEQEGAMTVSRTLIGKAIKQVFLESFPDPQARSRSSSEASAPDAVPEQDTSVFRPIQNFFREGGRVEVSDMQPDDEYLTSLANVPGLADLTQQYLAPGEEALAAGMELVLEGLYQCSFVAKENLDRASLYSDMLMRMFEGMGESRGD